jgi:prevent-host-death family protein
MEKPISAAVANREFSQLLQGVKKGNSYIVTSHGTPVARVVPVVESSHLGKKARSVLLARLEAQPVIEIGHWTREEMYSR